MINMANGISVLIACYNSEKVIQGTLEHLQAQIDTELLNCKSNLVQKSNCTINITNRRKGWIGICPKNKYPGGQI
jgi:glycosyltransferase involved in cell wall biosynthesis